MQLSILKLLFSCSLRLVKVGHPLADQATLWLKSHLLKNWMKVAADLMIGHCLSYGILINNATYHFRAFSP